MSQCAKCRYLYELAGHTDKTERDRFLVKELFALLHDGDVCEGTNNDQ